MTARTWFVRRFAGACPRVRTEIRSVQLALLGHLNRRKPSLTVVVMLVFSLWNRLCCIVLSDPS